MDSIRHGRKVFWIAVSLAFVLLLLWRNSTCRLRLIISGVGDAEGFVGVCKAEANMMEQSGTECIDGRQYTGPLRVLSPQIIAIRRGSLLDIQLRGGFAHKGLLVDVGDQERRSVSHAHFKTVRIMSRVYLGG